MGISATLLVAVATSWWTLGRLLATDRGVDLTDEGLYLLGADPPSLSAAWGFPFGWHVRPLFMVVGYDIASFRTLGAVLLVGASTWLGWSAGRVMLNRAEPRGQSQGFLALAAISGGLGSLMFYAPMLRTPSYNWLNLVGITTVAAAALGAVALSRSPTLGRDARVNRTLFALLATVSSFALFVTFPAKPSTLPIMLLLTCVLLLATVGRRAASAWGLISVALLPIWLSGVFLLRVWPRDALEVFSLALQMPSPDPLQTTGSAIRAALFLPTDLVSSLSEVDWMTLVVVLFGLALVAIPVVRRRDWIAVRLIGFSVACVGALSLAGLPIPGLRSALAPFAIANARVTTACLVIFVAALMSASRRPTVSVTGASRSLPRWPVVAFLGVLPFAFSFGSGNGIYAQASLAGGFLLLAGLVTFSNARLGKSGLALSVGGALFIACVSTGAVVSGWQAPFRAAPLVDQTVATSVGEHGAVLLLEPRIAETISGLRSKAEEVGWTNGTPIVDVSYTWNPTIPYALGGRVPDFLVLTIFGYPAAHDITDFHLSAPYFNFPFDRSWFVTSRPASISDPTGQAAVDFTMDKLSAVSGLPFPDSYACMAVRDFILWRPVSSEEAGEGCES